MTFGVLRILNFWSLNYRGSTVFYMFDDKVVFTLSFTLPYSNM